MECNLVWNHTRDFKIGGARSASSIRNHKYDFRPKLHDTKFNYHFITAILKSQNSISTNILLSERRYSFAKLKKFTDLYGWGGGEGEGGEGQVCAPHHTNVCKISPLWGFMSSLIFNKSLSNLALLLILRRSFQWCGRIFVNLSMSKVEKNREKVSTQFLQILLVTTVYVKREA